MTSFVNSEPTPAEYTSAVAYDGSRVQTAALYCSDGRFGAPTDDFLTNVLPRYNRLVIPGGPACLAGYFISYREEEAAAEQFKFLVTALGISRILIVAHEDCLFYQQRLNISPFELRKRQTEDLGKAARRLKGISGTLQIEAYLAHIVQESVRFMQVATE